MREIKNKFVGRPIKTNGYSSVKLHAKRQRKREEAEARAEAWGKLTPQRQLNALKKRPGESVKQVARIKELKKTLSQNKKD